MSKMKIIFFLVFFFSKLHFSEAQTTKRVLFIGNSYTYVNNLPQLVANVAAAQGDSLIFDSSAPGSYTFQLHSAYAPTLSKIAQATWDYVVLQEQSQLPSFPPSQVATDCLPYARALDSLVHVADSCAETIFYMTWGRKNGDAANCGFYPPLCSYAGMQERLRQSYLLMAQQNNAVTAPVGSAWREVRNQNPSFDLYQADESHPSIYGSYIAACVFYTLIFQKPVYSLSYTAGIATADAYLIIQQTNAIMADSLQQWTGNGNIPFANFTHQQNGAAVQFNNLVSNGASLAWNFGDSHTSATANPQHTYTANGTYIVSLTATTNCLSHTFTDTITISNLSVGEINAQSVYYT